MLARYATPIDHLQICVLVNWLTPFEGTNDLESARAFFAKRNPLVEVACWTS